jgi:hypothetical protein
VGARTTKSLLRRCERPTRAGLAARLRAIGGLAAVAALLLVPSAGGAPPPLINVSISGTSGANGWFRSGVTVAWTVSDPTGISSSSGCGTTVLSVDTAGTTLVCSATNNADPPLSTSVSVTIKIDKTPPEVTGATPERAADANGWYNRPVSFAFAGTDTLSGIDGCAGATYGGPDAAEAAVVGACRDKAGNSGSRSFGLRYDATPPSVAAQADRPPNGAGWYNRPVTVAFSGADGASGVESCTSATYRGPDGAGVAVSGSCRNRAGLTGTASSSLNYDATPPTLSAVSVARRDGVNLVRWAAAPTDTVFVRRSARGQKKAKEVFRGRGSSFADRGVTNGFEYAYALQAQDPAGNESKAVRRVALPRVLTLRRLPYVPRVTGRPTLRWKKVRRATYFHIQLFRGGARVLAAWPRRTHFRLPARWRYAGRRYSLEPGTYRWYAWAGRGRRSARDYVRLGTATFIVVRRPPQ